MEELGLTPEKMDARREELNAKLAAADERFRTAGDPKPARKPRSDKGVPKGPKVKPEPEIRATEFQWRVQELMQAETNLYLAQAARDRKWAEYCEFVDKAIDSLRAWK